MSCKKPGTPPPGFFFESAPRAERRLGACVLTRMTWGIAVLQGLSMLSGPSRPESGDTPLPLITWVIPVVTGVIVLLALATALA
jgi:hypothetical protein